MTEVVLHSVPLPAFDYSRLTDADARFAEHAAKRIRKHQRAAMVEIGRDLQAVKDRLAHGAFSDWIDAECDFGRRTAANLMQVARTLGAKWESVSHLPPTLLYALAAKSTPDDFRNQALEVVDGQRLDADSLRIHLRERKRREASAKSKQRKKVPTPSQKANERRQAKKALARQREIDVKNRERTEQAERLATLLVATIGNHRAEALAGLRDIDPYRLVEALRIRLGSTTVEHPKD